MATAGFLRIAGRRALLASALEIGLVPAAALEAETCGRYHLGQGRPAARRAVDEGGVRDFLNRLVLVPARLATVFVDRHHLYSVKGISP